MKNCNSPINTPLNSAYKIEYIPVVQLDKIGFHFALYDSFTNEEKYYSDKYYTTKYEARRQANFIRLRIALDQEKCPTLIIDLETRKILSVNLAAFCLLGINAEGFGTSEFMTNYQSNERFYQELQEKGRFCQSLSLLNADGQLISCEIKAQTLFSFSEWGIVITKINSAVKKYSPIIP